MEGQKVGFIFKIDIFFPSTILKNVQLFTIIVVQQDIYLLLSENTQRHTPSCAGHTGSRPGTLVSRAISTMPLLRTTIYNLEARYINACSLWNFSGYQKSRSNNYRML